MKVLSRVFAVLVLMALCCSATAFAQATVYRESSGQIDMAGWIWFIGSCAEPVAVEKGFYSYRFQGVFTPGERYEYKFEVNAHGSTKGLYSGAEYIFQTVSNFSQSGDWQDGLPLEFTQTASVKLVGKGQGADMFVHYSVHITIRPDGVATATPYNFRLVCK